jgi:hypothetical protein
MKAEPDSGHAKKHHAQTVASQVFLIPIHHLRRYQTHDADIEFYAHASAIRLGGSELLRQYRVRIEDRLLASDANHVRQHHREIRCAAIDSLLHALNT